MFQKRSQRRAESNICVDLHMCGISLWSLSAGPPPSVAAHTLKSYERCGSPCGYRHFNNAWIIQSKSIAIDLSGAAKGGQGRKKWCNSTLKTTLKEGQQSFSLWFFWVKKPTTALNPCTPLTPLPSSFRSGRNIKRSAGPHYKKTYFLTPSGTVSSLADNFDSTRPGFERSASEIYSPSEYNTGEWNFACGTHSIEKLHLRTQEQCLIPE